MTQSKAGQRLGHFNKLYLSVKNEYDSTSVKVCPHLIPKEKSFMATPARLTKSKGQSETPAKKKSSAKKVAPLSPVKTQSNASRSSPKLPSPLKKCPRSSNVLERPPSVPIVGIGLGKDVPRATMVV